MNDAPAPHEDDLANATREEIMAALFANMVIQQTNMAMMLLGKVAHPETGQFIKDVESAKMFIDQLEMLEAKTKGNLSKQEDGLLKQALSAVHMTFVEAVDGPSGGIISPHESATESAPAPIPAPAPTPKLDSAPAQPATAPAEPPPEAEESRKKFSKKY